MNTKEKYTAKRQPTYMVQHENSEGSLKTEIKYTGKFNKNEIQNGILYCVEKMVEGDTIEYMKDDHSKVYAGHILLLSLQKRNGKVMREILQGARAGRFVRFNYFKGSRTSNKNRS